MVEKAGLAPAKAGGRRVYNALPLLLGYSSKLVPAGRIALPRLTASEAGQSAVPDKPGRQKNWIPPPAAKPRWMVSAFASSVAADGGKGSKRQDSHLRRLGPRPSACNCQATLRKVDAGAGVAPTSPGLMRPGGTTGSTRKKWTRRRDLHPRTSALQAGPLAARAHRGKTCTAAQVARRRKTSPTSALNDHR